jgi:hypothetical protein
VLLLAISVCVGSIIDFGHNAYQRTNLFRSDPDPFGGQTSSDYREWGKLESVLEQDMQLDVAVALLAAAAVLGTSVALSKLSRREKRLVFGAEAVVLTLIVVFILVLSPPSP